MVVVAGKPHVSLVDRPGGPSLRDQIRSQERGIAEKEQAQLARCPAAQQAALKSDFTEARAERARKYAAMLCSAPGWQPNENCSPEGKVLTAFYQVLGERGRELAAKDGKPFSLTYLDKVKLSKDDVEKLRKQFGDDAVKKAMPLLQKHIVSGKWLSKDAARFMASGEFMTYQTAIMGAQDKMERDVEAYREKLDEKAADDLREESRTDRKRQLTHWTDKVVVEKDATTQEKTIYAAVGGRLIPVDKKPE